MFVARSGTKRHGVLPGMVRRQAVVGDSIQMVEYTLSKGAIVPWHCHPNEQIGMVVSGSMIMKIGTEARTIGPGDGYVIPPGTEHGAEVLEDTVVIDVFSPPRDDYRDR